MWIVENTPFSPYALYEFPLFSSQIKDDLGLVQIAPMLGGPEGI